MSERGDMLERRRVLVERLVALRAQRPLSTEEVRGAAAAAEVDERTVWRWVASGAYAPATARATELNARRRELFFATGGNVHAVHRLLVAEADEVGESVPSLSALRRAFARELTPAEVAFARTGVEGARARNVYLRWEPEHRADGYAADHKQLSIEVLGLRGQRPVCPWVTIFLDEYSRLIVGWAISLRPTQAEVLAALRSAVVVDEDRGRFGGIPVLLRFDGGLEFAARSVYDAAATLGCLAVKCRAYHPWLKGKLERLNRTIEQTLLCELPRWTGGPSDAAGRLLDERAPLKLELLVELFDAWVRSYNTERPHRGLRGQTPLERWRQDARPVEALDAEQARWMLMPAVTRKIQKDGVSFPGGPYIAAELTGRGGQEVEVRYMPHDQRFVEIYLHGKWLATAKPQHALTREERTNLVKRRGREEQALKRELARVRRRHRIRVAPITEPGELQETTILTTGAVAGPAELAERRERRTHLRLLGIDGRRARARDRRMSEVRQHLGLQANTMATTSLQLTQLAVEDLVELEAMGVVYGPAGCGKTFAWQTAVQTLDVPVCAVQFPSHPTPLRVAQVLMAKLTGQRTPKASRFALSDDLIDLLCEQPRLVVIDEAQWLNRDCIEYVRHLHDEPDTRFGLLLVGGEGCWQVLSREPMLRSRLYHRVVFKPMTAEAVLRVIRSFTRCTRMCRWS